jgi:hypothetical protein
VTELSDRAAGLLDLLEAVWGVPYSVPNGLVIRLAALAAPSEVVYADAALTAVDVGVAGGKVLLLTADLVVLAEVNESTAVKAWPRAALLSLVVPEGGGEDDPWGQVPAAGWPQGSQAVLRYAHRTEPLLLPLSADASKERRAAFAGVLPSLVKDLQR